MNLKKLLAYSLLSLTPKQNSPMNVIANWLFM